jgi:hypothetical protein
MLISLLPYFVLGLRPFLRINSRSTTDASGIANDFPGLIIFLDLPSKGQHPLASILFIARLSRERLLDSPRTREDVHELSLDKHSSAPAFASSCTWRTPTIGSPFVC